VLEHLPKPADLLRQLYETIAIRNDAVVFFEVPNALFTLERLGIWDIIHEHVSYFTPSSLVRAFHSAGFTVCHAESAFDDQFLWLEASVGGDVSRVGPPRPPPDALYSSFSARFAEKVSQWRQRINELRSDGRYKSAQAWPFCSDYGAKNRWSRPHVGKPTGPGNRDEPRIRTRGPVNAPRHGD
jgi:hypothetical protein